MYLLIGAKVTTKHELDEHYDLDEFLKLYHLWRMTKDIEAIQADELREQMKK